MVEAIGRAQISFQWKGISGSNAEIEGGMKVTRIYVTLPGASSSSMVDVADKVVTAVPMPLPCTVKTADGETRNMKGLNAPTHWLNSMQVSAHLFVGGKDMGTRNIDVTNPRFVKGGKYCLRVFSDKDLRLTVKVMEIERVGAAASEESILEGQSRFVGNDSFSDIPLLRRLVSVMVTIEQLRALDIDALLSTFEAAHVLDKQLAVDRLNALLAGNLSEIAAIVERETLNQTFISQIEQVLQDKGASQQIPQTAEYRALVEEEARLTQACMEKVQAAMGGQ